MALMDTIKGWFGKAADVTGDAVDKTGDAASAGWDKTKDVVGGATDAVTDQVDDWRGKGDGDDAGGGDE